MPFQSTISNPGTNVSIAGSATSGVSAPRTFSFYTQSGPTSYANYAITFPTDIGEKNQGYNDQYRAIYVKGKNLPNGATLYWTILHQTTTDYDFEGGYYDGVYFNGFNGSFTVTNEIGRFSIFGRRDYETEGPQYFQIQIRQWSLTGPVVLTSPLIAINDTSKTPTYIFDSANATSLTEGTQGSGFSGQASQFRILTNNVDPGYLYYTFTSPTAVVDKNVAGADISYWSDEPATQYFAPDNQVWIYAYTGANDPTTGSGYLWINGRNDGATEGTETFQIQLRTGSITGPIVATSPEISIQDTTVYLGPPTPGFQYQVIGGGAGGPTTTPGGGGGGGGFASGSMAWSSAYNKVSWQVSVGAGGAPLTSGGDSYITSTIAGGTQKFWGRGGGRGATTTTAAYWGGGGGGGCGNNAGSNTWLAYGVNQWDNVTGSVIVTSTAANRQAGYGGSAGGPYTAGGGGGASTNGYSGGSGTVTTGGTPGKGGAGKTNWLGTTCGQGGGAVNKFGTQGARYNANASINGTNPGEAGQFNGYGANGAVIIRYSESYAPAVSAPGAVEYIIGGYRYYVWTTIGNYGIRFN